MPLLAYSVAVMTLAQLLDLATFAMMIERFGPAAEANPVVAGVLKTHGLALLAIGKTALVALVTAIAVILARRGRPASHRRIAAGVLALAIVVGLVGGWTNSLTLTFGPL